MWDGFDKRQKAKLSSGAGPAANEDADAADVDAAGGDMFSRAGIAAE